MSLGYGSKEPRILMAQIGVALSLSLASCTQHPRMALGWPLAARGPVLYLWPPHRAARLARPTVAQGNNSPLRRAWGWAAGRGRKEDRLQLAPETDLLVPISPPALPPPEGCPQGLEISQKSQATFQGPEGGEGRSPSLRAAQRQAPPLAVPCP